MHIEEFPSPQVMRRHLHADRAEIIAYQNHRLRRLIEHAYKNVPFYRKRFDRVGLKPKDIRSSDDLRAIPVTTKNDLKAAPLEDTVAAGLDPAAMITVRTSGSTGEPFRVRHAPAESRGGRDFFFRAKAQFGVRTNDRTAGIAYLEDRDTASRSLRGRLRTALGLNRLYPIDCVEPAPAIIAKLEKIKPDVISGYAGVLSHLAPFAAESRARGLRPRLIVSGSEWLSPSMRRRIEEGFGAPVFDTYGSLEMGLLAWQCPQTGLYHICEDNMVMEVLRDGRPVEDGECGEVVGTRLHRFAMPFIRYRLGDIVVKGPDACPCGAPFSTLRSIRGRMIDYYPLPDGRNLHHYALSHSIEAEEDWIDRYQIFQEKKERMVLRIVSFGTPASEKVERLEQELKEVLGPGVNFGIEFVEDIPPGPGGKFRFGLSLVRSDYDAVDWKDDATPSPVRALSPASIE